MRADTRSGWVEEALAPTAELVADVEDPVSAADALDAGLRSDLIARVERQQSWERRSRSLFRPLEVLRELFSGLAVVSMLLFPWPLVGGVLGFLTNNDALIRSWVGSMLAAAAIFGLIAMVGCVELLLWGLEALLGKLAKRDECEPTEYSRTNRVNEWLYRIGHPSNP